MWYLSTNNAEREGMDLVLPKKIKKVSYYRLFLGVGDFLPSRECRKGELGMLSVHKEYWKRGNGLNYVTKMKERAWLGVISGTRRFSGLKEYRRTSPRWNSTSRNTNQLVITVFSCLVRWLDTMHGVTIGWKKSATSWFWRLYKWKLDA